MVPEPKQDMTRQADISLLNRVLYGSIVHIKDVAIQTRLMLAVMNALNELEDAMHGH
jgi:hypothetical protein